MTQHIHLNNIVEKLQTIFDDARATFDPDLKRVVKSGVGLLPSTADLSDMCPAIFITPLSSPIPLVTSGSYEIDYPFRLVYVKEFEDNEEVSEKLILEIEKIIELLIDNERLPDLTLTDGQAIKSGVTGFDFDPPENDIDVQHSTNIVMGAILWEITVRVTR